MPIRNLTAFAAATLLACTAGAHTLWVNLTFYQAGSNATPLAYIGWGHRFPADGTLDTEKLGSYRLVSTDGKSTDLEPTPGGFHVAELPDGQTAPAVVAASFTPHFFTMWEKDGENQYLYGPKTGLENVKSSRYYEMYGKALYAAEKPDPSAFTKPIGETFEVIPSVNPASLQVEKDKPAPELEVTALLNGKPAPRTYVSATYMGYSGAGGFAQDVRVNAEGKATITLDVPGVWMIQAQTTEPIRDEWKNQVDEEQYTAVLTFAVPGPDGEDKGTAH